MCTIVNVVPGYTEKAINGVGCTLVIRGRGPLMHLFIVVSIVFVGEEGMPLLIIFYYMWGIFSTCMFKVIMNLLLHRCLRAGEVVLRITLVISCIAILL